MEFTSIEWLMSDLMAMVKKIEEQQLDFLQDYWLALCML